MKVQFNKLIVFFGSLTLLMNCKDAEIIPKEYPFIIMNEVETFEEGALFRGQVKDLGQKKILSYGFVWGTSEPIIGTSDTALISETFSEGIFEKRINYGLAKGVTYYVRPFAIYNTTTVYGNTVSFESLGSERSSWSLLDPENSNLKGWFDSYGSSINNKGYVLFQSSDFYSYNPSENKFLRLSNFPVSGNSGSQFTSISIKNSQYFFNSIDLNLYKLENDIWTIQSRVPFRYDRFIGYYQGHSEGNTIILLSSFESYEYDLNVDSWIRRSNIPLSTGYSVGGTSIDNKAYIITNDKSIWEYNIKTDQWKIKTEYPGVLEDKIISFSANNKIYFGLSHHDHLVSKNWMDKELWSFDLTQEKWELEELFPLDLEPGGLFYFTVENKLYIGHGQQNYDLWVFDPK